MAPARGGAAILKNGGQNVIHERSEWKKIVPPLFEMWGYEQANIFISIAYTEICCLAVT